MSKKMFKTHLCCAQQSEAHQHPYVTEMLSYTQVQTHWAEVLYDH